MSFVKRLCIVAFLMSFLATGYASANAIDRFSESEFNSFLLAKADTVITKDTSKIDSTKSIVPIDTNQVAKHSFLTSGIDPEEASIIPYTSLQQMLKGKVAGVYVQQPSGEPGSEMSMLIRGTAIPYLSHKDVYNAQPTVILDGIPLIMDNPFAFNIQQYDYNRLGPATNLLSTIDPDNIASIKVLKDFADAAIYGPRAANGGVIVINTKAPVIGGRKINIHSYVGFVQKPHVYTTNARYENNFRQPYYDRYAGINDILNYPLYLRDSTNPAYYGPSNWTDLYYKNRPIYGMDASLSNGTKRANFRFALGTQKSQNPADRTKMDRYNAMFELNMVPVQWLTVSSMIRATRLERVRNTSLRDRFATVEYLPDLENPLPANRAGYAKFLTEQDKSLDNNKSNVITGYFSLGFKVSKSLDIHSSFGFSYNEGMRDIFYPTTLMETVNYASNYFGFNQRLTVNNKIRWRHQWNDVHKITLEAGEIFESDFDRYNYTYAYKGPNDLIKLDLLNSDPHKDNYLSSKAFSRPLTFMFLDKERHHLLSFYGRAQYHYKNLLSISALVRSDGSSSAQPDNWWMVSPTFSASWNIKNTWLQDANGVDQLKLHASWGRIARLLTDDRFGEGPQYVSDLSFNNNPVKFSYNGFPGLSRPYSTGYVGYGIKWPYVDQTDIGADVGLLNNRLQFSIDVYNKVDKNMLFDVPSGSEYGYNGVYKNGLKVRNRGADLSIQATVFPTGNEFQWIPSVNMNYNKNQLLALPDGLNELVIGSGESARMLKVGHAIDQYWLLKNKGIYNREKDIPSNPQTSEKIEYKGTPLQAGDPIWEDINGDQKIDNVDKVMTGHYLPQFSGGFSSDFIYRNFTLSFSLYFVSGREILNQDMSNRLDFINSEGEISMDAIKEVTFWKKTGDYNRYPMYNPWSKVEPYRLDQDLFLENGSFMKLRSISLQYDFTGAGWWKEKSAFKGLQVYVTAGNLFTITPYTGRDPELVNYNGVDNGYGLPIPKTFTFGVKARF